MTRCNYCLGEHEPDTKDTHVEWQGKKYHAPFICLCCGKETCARQWAYGRSCAVCDTGLCQTNPEYYHAPYHPKKKRVEEEHYTEADYQTWMRL